MRPAALLLLALTLAACEGNTEDFAGPEPSNGRCLGNPGVYVFVELASPNTAIAANSVKGIARAAPASGDGCAALWREEPMGLAENQRMSTFELARDRGILFPIQISEYPRLTFLAYVYESDDTSGTAFAGGCKELTPTPGVDTECMIIPLAPR